MPFWPAFRLKSPNLYMDKDNQCRDRYDASVPLVVAAVSRPWWSLSKKPSSCGRSQSVDGYVEFSDPKVMFPREQHFETPSSSTEGYTTTVELNLLTSAAAHLFLVSIAYK